VFVLVLLGWLKYAYFIVHLIAAVKIKDVPKQGNATTPAYCGD
jgi:hypothetical protein